MVYLEIRAGEGGDDASLFASQLTDAVTRWAKNNGCTVEQEPGVLVLDGDAHCL
jgi:protein subunit release factor A